MDNPTPFPKLYKQITKDLDITNKPRKKENTSEKIFHVGNCS